MNDSGAGGQDPKRPAATQVGVPPDENISATRRRLFGDCALIEIIHLHDCLRGALQALEDDVAKMTPLLSQRESLEEVERRVAGRFKVIWSVFRAHSAAEDEFIWPALQRKTQGAIQGSPKRDDAEELMEKEESIDDHAHTGIRPLAVENAPSHPHDDAMANGKQTKDAVPANVSTASIGTENQSQIDTKPVDTTIDESSKHQKRNSDSDTIVQEEYEEDHADEERMFSRMDTLLSRLRSELGVLKTAKGSDASKLDDLTQSIHALTKTLNRHLMAHLEKEEKQCMPLVVKHLNKSEIHELVGNIMGKRSSEIIANIMTMAVQNLNDSDREEMVRYMKQAMAGTFFDRWLSMSGWMKDKPATLGAVAGEDMSSKKRSATPNKEAIEEASSKKPRADSTLSEKETTLSPSAMVPLVANSSPVVAARLTNSIAGEMTSQNELEKLIRAIAANPNLTSQQKNTTIQGLRDSVWKSNQKAKRDMLKRMPTPVLSQPATSASSSACATISGTTTRRVTPPTLYFKKIDGKVKQVWSSGESSCLPVTPEAGTVPLFSASELAPCFHDGVSGTVLGCPHYARACKLRHPQSGRLYTCRLCCEQDREMPSKDRDEPLDRYAVTEVLCMKCSTLQPAEDRCMNPACESSGRPFAKYFCRICHLYDDRPNPIFHCPYCNTCRMGQGLGIDYRHCMTCNCCVSLSDDSHRCIPQRLQGSCPICHESLFQSTDPLKGLQCGHVMHLNCFVEYRRQQNYTCPLCMRSMDDMSDYFRMLDAAVRMQPMPITYINTIANIYCQDCEKTGQCRYHFVGNKCPHCGSYNTRELGRTNGSYAS